MTEKKDKKIYVFEVLIFLKTLSLDDIHLGNFTL